MLRCVHVLLVPRPKIPFNLFQQRWLPTIPASVRLSQLTAVTWCISWWRSSNRWTCRSTKETGMWIPCGLVSSSIDSIYWKVEKESPTTEAWLDCAVDWSVESWKSNSFEQTYFWSGCLVFSEALDFVVWILWHNLVCNPSRLPSSASYACNSSFFPPRGHWRPLHWTNWHDPCLQKANALEPAVRCDNECTTLGMQEARILQDVMHSTSCSRSFTT